MNRLLNKLLNRKIENKFVVLAGVLLAQLTIAGLYAWSALGLSMQLERGWSDEAVILPYSIAQTVFALTTIVSGRLVDLKGPRISMLIGAVLYGGGLLISGFAHSPLLIYISYGVIAGMGIGFIYVCPLATLVKWFPDKKGLVTGLSVAVFASGSIFYKQLISFMMEFLNVSGSFILLGVLSFILIFVGALLTSNPPDYSRKEAVRVEGDFTTREMVRTRKFRILWVMYLLAAMPGLLILGAAANIGMEVGGLSRGAALGLITILAISNGSSRLLAGFLSDRFGSLPVIRLSFMITILSTVLLMANYSRFFFMAGIIGVVVGYGGFLALFPVYTNKAFGSYRYGSNYSIVYQAYGLASLIGILAKSFVGSFSNLFIVVAVTSMTGLVLAYGLDKGKDNNKTA